MPYDSTAPHYREFLQWVHAPARDGIWNCTLYPSGRASLRYVDGDYVSIEQIEDGLALIEISISGGNKRLSAWMVEDDAYVLLSRGLSPAELMDVMINPPSSRPAGGKGRHRI